MASRPRLLFLAYAFPPLATIACVRCWSIAKHLSRHGWEVTVVTPEPGYWRCVEDATAVERAITAGGLRRVLTGHRLRWLNPVHLQCWNRGPGWLFGGVCRRIARSLDVEAEIGWNASVRQRCKALRPGDVDLILASGNPFSAFPLAREFSERLHCPYALDYRDLWTANPLLSKIHHRRTLTLERGLLADAAVITTISPSCAAILRQRCESIRRLHVLTNGYDPEELDGVVPRDFGHFAIVYAGTFYPPLVVLDPVLRALQILQRAGQTQAGWRFHYFGAQTDYVRAVAAEHDLTDRVVLHGRVTRAEALAATRGASVSVVVASVAPTATIAECGIVTGKIYEPLGLDTPILLIAPPGSDAESIVAAGGGRRFTGDDAAGMASHLAQLMSQPRPHSRPADEYAWPTLICGFDAVLRQALTAAVPPTKRSAETSARTVDDAA